MEKNKLLKISPITQAIVLRKLGIYCSERLGINDLHLLEVVNLLITEVGEDWLKEKYKGKQEDWEEVKEKLKRLRIKLAKAKTFYDSLEDKSFKKKYNSKTIEKAILRYFQKTASKISLLQPTLYELFIIIVQNSDIQRGKIPSDSLKILEHLGMRKMLLPKKPTLGESTDSPEKNK